jgi:putative membrane protein
MLVEADQPNLTNQPMKRNLHTFTHLTVAAIALLLGTTALAQNPRLAPSGAQKTPSPDQGRTQSQSNGSSLSANDRDFMRAAAEGGMEEVEMGRMAEQQGKSADVKAFGRRMVIDHSKANSELMALASRKGVKLPTHAPKKEKMHGDNFDKQYISDMVKDHEKDLAEFQREASNGSDPDVKAFATKNAKVIQKHLELAKADQAKLK